MIRPASFEDECFIVLLPGGLVAENAGRLQRVISDEYELYNRDEMPPLHITLDRIRREDKLEAARIAVRALKENSTEMNIMVEDFNCMSQDDNRFLVLNVRATNSLQEFSRELHDRLSDAGISTLDNYDEWQFHITLVNNHFVDRPLTFSDFKGLCLELEDEVSRIISPARRLEIWRPISDEEKRRYFSIDLTEVRPTQKGETANG